MPILFDPSPSLGSAEHWERAYTLKPEGCIPRFLHPIAPELLLAGKSRHLLSRLDVPPPPEGAATGADEGAAEGAAAELAPLATPASAGTPSVLSAAGSTPEAEASAEAEAPGSESGPPSPPASLDLLFCEALLAELQVPRVPRTVATAEPSEEGDGEARAPDTPPPDTPPPDAAPPAAEPGPSGRDAPEVPPRRARLGQDLEGSGKVQGRFRRARLGQDLGDVPRRHPLLPAGYPAYARGEEEGPIVKSIFHRLPSVPPGVAAALATGADAHSDARSVADFELDTRPAPIPGGIRGSTTPDVRRRGPFPESTMLTDEAGAFLPLGTASRRSTAGRGHAAAQGTRRALLPSGRAAAAT
jgi:hypothetical protein